MVTVGKFRVLILVAVAIGLWLHASVAPTPAAVTLAVPTVSVPAPSAAQTSGYAELTGTAIMDESAGLPAVPYIKYQPEGHGVLTKQLIFMDSRGCYPSAGDIPCVSFAGEYAYPSLITGQRIHVQGYLRDNRFLVEHIDVIG